MYGEIDGDVDENQLFLKLVLTNFLLHHDAFLALFDSIVSMDFLDVDADSVLPSSTL